MDKDDNLGEVEELEEEIDENTKAHRNLNLFLLSTMGLVRDNLREKRFQELRNSGEFARSGMDQVAETLMDSLSRLQSHTRVPYAFFIHGRRYQMAFSHFCRELNRFIEFL